MSDPILSDRTNGYVTASSHLFTSQKMLAVTNSLVPVTKSPLNALRIIAVVLNHPEHSHTPHYTVDKEKAVFEIAEKYYGTAPTSSVYLFDSTALWKVLPNRLQQGQLNPTVQELCWQTKLKEWLYRQLT